MQSGKTKILQNLFFFPPAGMGGIKIENPAKVLIWKFETIAKCEHFGKNSTGRTGRCWSQAVLHGQELPAGRDVCFLLKSSGAPSNYF